MAFAIYKHLSTLHVAHTAKRIPHVGVEEMESYMQYSVKSRPNVDRQQYYSNLELVSTNIYASTLQEFEEEQKRRTHSDESQVGHEDLDVKTVHGEGTTITISHTSQPGHYVFNVNVSFDFGLLLAFLFTRHEVRKCTNHVMVSSFSRPDRKDQSHCPLFALPKEVRDLIYTFALPTGTWDKPTHGSLLRDVAEAFRTCSGFYFPFKDMSLLETCRGVRTEALAIAFQKSDFRLDDIDEVVQFLIAAGSVGRHNVHAIEFSWLSNSDRELQWQNAPATHEFYPTLPLLHVGECMSLLRQCDNLNSLCLKFDETSIADLSYEALQNDPGLKHLYFDHKLQSLQILSIEGELLEQTWFAEWLRDRLLIRDPVAL